MNRKGSFGRPIAWILLAVCFLPVAMRAEVQAPWHVEPGGSPTAEAADDGTPAIENLTTLEANAGPDEVRVFLGTSGSITARPFLLESPDRLVVDLRGVQSTLKKSRIDVNSTLVSRVRVGQHHEGATPVARVVLDLAQASPYHIDPAPGGLMVTVGGSRTDPAVATGTADGASAGTSETQDPILRATRGLEDPDGEQDPSAPPATQGTIPGRSTAGVQGSSTGAAMNPARMDALAASAGEAPAAGRDSGARAAEPTKIAQVEMAEKPQSPAMREAKPLVPSSATTEAKSVRTASLTAGSSPMFETKTIAGSTRTFTGKKISLNLVDADVKQVFRLFHEISGLNFVLDPGVSGTVTIVLDEVPWDQALDIILKNNGLDKVFEENVIRIATTQKLASEAGGRKALREAKELEVEPVTITRRLSYAKAKEIDSIIKTGVLLSQRGKSFFDDRTNTLIVTDVPTKIEPLDKLISALDAKTPQVLIEARIVLTGRDFIQDLGIDWGFTFDRNSPRNFANGSNNFPHHGEVTYALNLPRAAAASRLGFDLFNRSGSFNLQVALDALEVDGRSRTLSAPKIATQNNVKAEIEQGVQIPIANSTATEINIEFVSASLKLSVTPQITAEGTVIMDVTVENNQPSKTIRLESGIPGIDTQRAQTKVMVEDGGTTVIGGIFSVNEGRNESGVPFLRRIPVFGWLFKSRSITIQNRELLIFITPKILKST